MLTKQIKISKEKILQAAFDITREKGIEYVSNREIARRLSSSIRPIYYQFKNSEELMSELYVKIEKYFYQYITSNLTSDMTKYKQTGINYIKFAKNEKYFFKALFMSKTTLDNESFIKKDYEDYKVINEFIKESTKLDEKDIISFHNLMWLYTHGIACLIATETLTISDEEISKLLTEEYKALMLLNERKKDEKNN